MPAPASATSCWRGSRGPSWRSAGSRPAIARGLLLEMQRATLLMYASCAWFFDDVAGLEASLGLRLAAYAIDLMGQAGGEPPIEGFLERLSEAKSNVREEGTGADVFRRVTGDRFTARHAVAFAGAAGLIGPAWVAPAPSGYAVDIRDERGGPGPAGIDVVGAARGRRRDGPASSRSWSSSALERAGSGLEIEVRVGGETLTLADLGRDHRERLVWAAIRKRLASGAPSELALLRLAVEAAKEAQGTSRGGRQRIRRGRRRRARATTASWCSCSSGCSSASRGRCRATRSRSRRSCWMRRTCLRTMACGGGWKRWCGTSSTRAPTRARSRRSPSGSGFPRRRLAAR